MPISIEQPTEKRHAGVMSLLVRNMLVQNKSHLTEVCLLLDQTKSETTAGPLPVFTQGGQRAWGVVAGGRSEVNARPETVHQTLLRELQEELGDIGLLIHGFNIALDTSTDVLPRTSAVLREARQLSYPFVVAQKKVDTASTQINEIASTVVVNDIDTLPLEIERELRRGEQRGVVQWTPLESLVCAFYGAQKSGEYRVASQSIQAIRPQVLTAAHLYYLDAVVKADPEDLSQMVTRWNRRLISYLKQLAHRDPSVRINNGTLTTKGTIRRHLPQEDHRYLNVYAN